MTKLHSLAACMIGIGCVLIFAPSRTDAQVTPFEIRNPKLREAEQTYLRNMIDLNRAISELKFPFSFQLNRYAGLDPKDQVESDTRGIEFVKFHDRVVLKITGNYNAAFSSTRLTRNQRADRVFEEIISPILKMLPSYFKPGDDFDDVGFEICYHVLAKTSRYDYEGKEMMAVVIEKARALSFASLAQREAQQEWLNQSDVYLNGKPFGLALGQTEPIDLDTIVRHKPQTKVRQGEGTKVAAADEDEDDALARSIFEASSINNVLRPSRPAADPASADPSGPSRASPAAASGSVSNSGPTNGSASQADVDALQSQYQSSLDALSTEDAAKYHIVDYAPPSFVLFRNRAYLQMTLRGTEKFDRESTSIYKRAARTFDLFLAPELKALLGKIPQDQSIAGLDITVLDQLEAHGASTASKANSRAAAKDESSEAIEFICPLNLLKRFADAEITNQDLIDHSIVLVNGVRIALNLQQVE